MKIAVNSVGGAVGDIITDAIEYAVDGYTEVELNQTHLPAGINAGY